MLRVKFFASLRKSQNSYHQNEYLWLPLHAATSLVLSWFPIIHFYLSKYFFLCSFQVSFSYCFWMEWLEQLTIWGFITENGRWKQEGNGYTFLGPVFANKIFQKLSFLKKKKKCSVMVSKSVSIACITLRNILRMNYIQFLPSSVNLS